MAIWRSPRRVLVWSMTLLAAAYGGILIWFSFHEADYLYFPQKTYETTPVESGMVYGQVQITSTDSVRLVAWLIPSADTSTLWLLYLHGNAGNIGRRSSVEHYAHLCKLSLNVLAIDYRGYGESSGTPGEEGIYEDARAGYDYLRSHQHVPGERIVVYGYSLGSAAAVDLAGKVPVAGLVVEGSFTSLADVAQYHYPFLPVRFLAREKFASDEKIGEIGVLKLFIHAIDDRTVPIQYGRRLFEMAHEPKMFLEVKGGHESARAIDADLFYCGIRVFLVQITARGDSLGSIVSVH